MVFSLHGTPCLGRESLLAVIDKVLYEMAYQIFQQCGQFLGESRKLDKGGAEIWVVST